MIGSVRQLAQWLVEGSRRCLDYDPVYGMVQGPELGEERAENTIDSSITRSHAVSLWVGSVAKTKGWYRRKRD
jgi:hypothetical protein